MNIRERRAIHDSAAHALDRAPQARQIILVYAAVICGLIMTRLMKKLEEEHDVHTLYLAGTLTVNGVPTEFSVPLREWVVRDEQFFSIDNS